MNGNAVEDVVERMRRPSFLPRCSNWLAPRIEPPPGIVVTLKFGCPGMCLVRKGVTKRVVTSPAPPAANGTMTSMVLPA